MECMIAGVCLHAVAGDLAALGYGERGLTATDVVDAFGMVWAAWERGDSVLG